MSYANMTIKGNLTRDPELRSTTEGKPIATFTVGYNDGFGQDKKGVFVKCLAFGKRAEAIAQYVKKGDAILVSGAPSLEQWTSMEGEARAQIKVVVEGFDFCGGKRQSQEEPPKAQEPQVGSGQSWQQPFEGSAVDDDLPF